MKTISKSISVLLLLLSSAVGGHATLVLPPGSSWEYSTDLGVTWNPSSPAPFGNNRGGFDLDSTGLFDYRTVWPPLGQLWVRTSINLTGYNLSSIRYDLGVDNGYELYANGSFVAADYEGGYTYRWEYSGPIPQAVLHTGNNQLLVKLADDGGLTAFDMQVSDDSAGLPLALTCPADLSLPKDANQCAAAVDYPAPAASGGVGPYTIVCSPLSGSVFPVGATTVHCSATDAAAHTAACSFTVKVNDAEPPDLTCPPDLTVQCLADVPPPNFTGGVTDDCDSNPVVTHAGDVAIGTHPTRITRTYRATDASGNTGTCTQIITVQGLAGGFDLNGDCCVDRADLNLVLDQIRAHSTDLTYDLNGDGKVDIADARLTAMMVTCSSHAVLIGHWAFEEGSGPTARDTSGNQLDGHIYNANYVPGKVGTYALNFNGSNSYVEIANTPVLSPASVGISLWFKSRNPQSYDYTDILDKGHGSGSTPYAGGYVFQNSSYTTAISLAYGNGSTLTGLDTPGGLFDAKWHHLVGNAGSSEISLYVDGVLINIGPGAGPVAQNDSDLFFGRHRALGRYFNGFIDDVRIYDGPLSQSDVTALYLENANNEPLLLTCPPALTVPNDANQCAAVVDYPAATASGGVGPYTIVCSPLSGSVFPVGATTVHCSATDAATHAAACHFTVQVNDTEPPALTCPPDLTVPCLSDVPPPNFTGSVTDNCDSNLVATHAGDAAMGINPTRLIRTYQSTDASGNTGTCTQVITLQGLAGGFDLNGDCCVDRADLNLLLDQIRAHTTDFSYDLNDDGKVDVADSRFLILHFTNPSGTPCPPH